jgi:hypothetical protein
MAAGRRHRAGRRLGCGSQPARGALRPGWLRAQRPAGGGAAHAGGGKRVNPEILRDGPRHHRLRELAQEHTATAVAALVDIIKDKKANVGPGIFRQSRGDGAAGGELISRWPYC